MPTTYLFVDEAGRGGLRGLKHGRQPYFIVGVLLANDPQALMAAVQAVRDRNHFRNELHWTKQGNLRARVYAEVARAISVVPSWEYKATRFEANAIDMARYDNQDHVAYNHLVRLAIDGALRYPRITIHDELDITIDTKQRLSEDNFLEYLELQFTSFFEEGGGVPQLHMRGVQVRDIDSKLHDLVQICDLLSGARHTMLTPQFCAQRKRDLARTVWLPSHCREWEFDFKRARKK